MGIQTCQSKTSCFNRRKYTRGLTSIDIKSKYKALRLSWIVRILNGNGWNDVIKYYVEAMGGLLFILRCNYDHM